MNTKITRKNFLSKSAAGLAAVSIAPKLYAFGKSANDVIRIGVIGPGRKGLNLTKSFMNIEGVQVVAASDVYGRKRERFENIVKDFYTDKKLPAEVKTYEHYQDLLNRSDVDAVIIATPDHWHALNAIDALKAGKDVYLEKPMTFTIREGQELRLAVRDYNRILGVGSQQRSDPQFQHAVKLVQDGAIGRIQKINAYVGNPPAIYDLPQQSIPEDLNWDLWLGPAPYVHYNQELAPPISLNPPKDEEFWAGWRWYRELGGGYTTDFGAHMFDIAQWGLEMDGSGPIEIIPAGYKGTPSLTFVYDNGVVMTEEPFNNEKTKGVKFWGNDGWIEISRGYFKGSSPSLAPELKNGEEMSLIHQRDFINALRERKEPKVPVEVGHSSCTVCTLGNIAYELGRPLRWNPDLEKFFNDPEAEKYLHREYRTGYQL
jgi:predicted dehydrogenase